MGAPASITIATGEADGQRGKAERLGQNLEINNRVQAVLKGMRCAMVLA